MGGSDAFVLRDCYEVQPKGKHHYMACYDGRLGKEKVVSAKRKSNFRSHSLVTTRQLSIYEAKACAPMYH